MGTKRGTKFGVVGTGYQLLALPLLFPRRPPHGWAGSRLGSDRS
jgi:hypothetical protein